MGLDSAIIQNPKVWETSGHVSGFSDPLGRLQDLQVALPGRQARRFGLPEEALQTPGRGSGLRPHRAARVQPDVQDERRGGRGLAHRSPTCGRRRRRGSSSIFKNVLRLDAHRAALRHRADRQVVPQRDHARKLRVPHARVRAGRDGVLRPARRERQVVRLLAQGALRVVRRARHRSREAAHARPRRRTSSRTTRPAARDIEYEYPFGWGELEGIACRTDFDLRRHSEASGVRPDATSTPRRRSTTAPS